MGSNIPAAIAGLIDKALIGTAKIEAGPANPPFEIPKIIIHNEAVR